MKKTNLFLILTLLIIGITSISAQNKKEETYKSIGGTEHESNIYGVKIGMDVPTALEAVFINAKRKPGQEKPDALKKEGKDEKDIRVIYKNLPKGEMQIVFADGKAVKEIILVYKQPIQYSDLRLPYSGNVEVALGGQRYDDRYTIGYTDNRKLQGVWWRDEKTEDDYKVRIIFTSTNRLRNSQFEFQKILQKAIFVTPGDEEKFQETVK